VAISDSYDFSMTRLDMAKEVLELIGVIDPTEAPDSDQEASVSRSINMMLKTWQAEGIHLWKRVDAVLFLEKSKNAFSIGPTGDHASDAYIQTAITADVLSGVAQLPVTSTTGMTAGDNIAVLLDGGDLQWSTILTVDDAAHVTMSANLTDDVSSGVVVFTYTNKIQRPTRVEEFRRRSDDGIETTLTPNARADYIDLSTKSTSSIVTQAYYQPTLNNGTMYVWPQTSDVSDVVRFTYQKPISDMDATTDTFDLPPEWAECVAYNAAVRVAPKFGKSPKPEVTQMAIYLKDSMMNFDEEPQSLRMEPDFD
jgi:hypothetical protein